MHHSLGGLAHHHNLGLVAVAAVVCVLASFTVFTTLNHARASHSRRLAWTGSPD